MSERDNLPAWDGKRGHHEAWFMTMSDGREGYWIRYTIHAPDEGSASGRLWFARFVRDDPEATIALNVPAPVEPPVSGGGEFEFRLGDAVLRSGHAGGSLAGAGHEVSWKLDFDTGAETYRLLPGALYRGAPTKPFASNPDTRFSGTIAIDGEKHELQEMPGQQGHVYGRRHAERWVWAQCNAFENSDAVVHGLTAQARRGPFTTPFATVLGIRWRGRWLRFSKVSRMRDYALGVWRIDAGDRRYRLTGRIAADPERMVRTRYDDPDGTPRFCHHTDVASSRFVLFERTRAGFEEVAVLRSEGTTHAEWAGRTPAPADMPEHVRVDKVG